MVLLSLEKAVMRRRAIRASHAIKKRHPAIGNMI